MMLLVLAVLAVRRVLTVGGVRREVLLSVVWVVRRLAVVELVVVAASSSCTRGVLVGAGGPGLGGDAHQTLLRERLFEDTLVKAAKRRAEVLEVGEAELFVP